MQLFLNVFCFELLKKAKLSIGDISDFFLGSRFSGGLASHTKCLLLIWEGKIKSPTFSQSRLHVYNSC